MDNDKYDSSWDFDYDENGYDDDAFDRKYEEWEERGWVEWLQEYLTFPFQVERMEDGDVDMFAPEESHANNPFPVGCHVSVTTDNIIDRQMPRNRRMAEAFAKCGLVERSEQGANRIFEEAIEQSKSLPDFGNTDEFQVCLILDGQVKDIEFLIILEKISKDRPKSFSLRKD